MLKIINSVIEGISVIGEVTLDLFFSKDEFKYLFKQIKLQNLDGHMPILRKTVEGSNYKAYLFTIPIGLSIEDFKSNKDAISQYLHKKESDVSIELVNNQALITVTEGELVVSYEYEDYEFKYTDRIPIGINKITGKIVYWYYLSPSDCHLIIGGATGSGKSTALTEVIAYIIDHIPNSKLYIQDTKIVDLPAFENVDRVEIYNEGRDYYEETIVKVVNEMEERYKWLKEKKCRNFNEYEGKDKLPHIFYIIEEINSFNSKDKRDHTFYENLQLILSKGRAAGITCITTAQNPYCDVLPGYIKSNFLTKLCLKTTTGEASKVLSGSFELLVSDKIRDGRGHGYLIDSNGTNEIQGLNIQKKTFLDIADRHKKKEIVVEDIDGEIIEDVPYRLLEGSTEIDIKKNVK